MWRKVNPHGLRVCLIKDWDSRWNHHPEIPEDFGVREKMIIPRVVGKLREWGNQCDKGMKNVPRKKPHHK